MLVRLSALAVAAASIVNGLSPAEIPSDLPLSNLLASAQSHLSKGETNDALVYYDAAIARDPSNYLTFFKRATTYLSLGRTSQATDDFNKVLALKPGFEGAHIQLGKLKARSADWDAAREHYEKARKADELAALEDAAIAAGLAEKAAATGDWEECVTQAGAAIMVANRAVALRELRSKCLFERGDLEMGMSDLQHILQMKPGDTTPHLKISAISFYALGDLQGGLTAIRKCLHSDPDSKVCARMLKEEKMTDKMVQKAIKALDKKQPMTAVKNLVPNQEGEGLIQEVKSQVEKLRADGTIPKSAGNALVGQLVELACQAYFESSSKKASIYCAESLAINPTALYALLHQSQVQMAAEEYDAAIATLQKALEEHPAKSDLINPLIQKAQIALKRSKTKDYYKVLGVSRDADERQIKSAYRKLSKLHHPDKAAKQGLTKETAEKKMAQINEAYEVLSDPELRARFDRGDDPNSHEGQQGGHPFGGQGGNPFMFQQGGPGGGFRFQYGSGGFPGGFPFGG
ncbi:Tetratricopeptide repeat and J domain-containing co-chaperone dnj1 [Neurospora sp. IMI 360204]|nr:Tetratricopeptide repeat and J domain-containing co-chaperone dnj1 [Neurospora sp. IMI 360204]